jgi:polysaccharide deacetylase family protein (PEP-CTERM system associated)
MTLKNILTVDVEDWYHICDVEHLLPRSVWDECESRILFNLEKILTLFGRFKVKATFFVLGYIAERHPEALRMIQTEGHEIASHGYGHLQVFKQTEEEFLQDLLKSKRLIESLTGEKVIGYRAPQWSICKGKRDSYWALGLLTQNGFLYDSSIAPLRFIGISGAPTTPYLISTSHGQIREYPPLVMPSLLGNLPVGGGWGLRIFPYRSIRRRIEVLNHQGQPALIFLHPSDFDTFRCPFRLPRVKQFVCYGRIKTTEERLTRLLNDFEFTPVREILIG